MKARKDDLMGKVVRLPQRKKLRNLRSFGGRALRRRREVDLLRRAADRLRSIPDIREDKVAAIRRRIERGTYRIDSGAIAKRMLKAHLDLED